MTTEFTWNLKSARPLIPARFKSKAHLQSLLLNELDGYTRFHCHRVKRIASKLGIALQLASDELQGLARAALFHDIGKAHLRRDILDKTNPLTPEEHAHIRMHPQIGAEIWMAAGGYYRISEAILTHHENYDGSGYPIGLKGGAIPLWARIISIADALDAMISHRPYSKPLAVEQALDSLNAAAGRQFDPLLVEKILRAAKGNGLQTLLYELAG